MTNIVVTSRSGETRNVEIQSGSSLMEALRGAGFDEILALCGGCCSCGTCHVYVDPEFIGNLPPVSDEERSLLDYSDHRTPFSRLACQIPADNLPERCRVTVAPED